MKKTLLYFSFFVTLNSFSQVLQSENFNSLTIGNVGTDITGATAGQGSWYTYSTNGTATTSTNASNANFQIVANGNSATNGLLIQSPNGNGGSRFMWQNGLDTAWASRTVGNNIIEVEYDFYTGSATTSTAQVGVRLYGDDAGTARVICGYVYNMNSRILQGVAYLNNGGTFGTYLITLETGGLILNADTWYRIGFGYDTTTGQPYWRFNASPSVSINPVNYAGPFGPIEADFVTAAPSTNALSSNMIFDNYVARATNGDTLLDVESFVTSNQKILIYPNPSNDFVNLLSKSSISKVNVIDINGRIVVSLTPNDVNCIVDVTNLSKGMYILDIETAEGVLQEKIIKN